MSANHPFKKHFGGFKKFHNPKGKKQETLDDQERVLPRLNRDHTMSPEDVKPRSRDALRVYEELQEMRLIEVDPLF